MSQGQPSWDDVLDAYETALRSQVAVLAGTADAAPAFEPPHGLAPLPARLEQRARALAEQTAGIGGALRAAADRIRGQIDAPRPSQGRTASFVDSSS